jgi:hypothetical protein
MVLIYAVRRGVRNWSNHASALPLGIAGGLLFTGADSSIEDRFKR